MQFLVTFLSDVELSDFAVGHSNLVALLLNLGVLHGSTTSIPEPSHMAHCLTGISIVYMQVMSASSLDIMHISHA